MREAIAGLNEEFQAMTKLDQELRDRYGRLRTERYKKIKNVPLEVQIALRRKYGRLESKENQAILDALSPEERSKLDPLQKLQQIKV